MKILSCSVYKTGHQVRRSQSSKAGIYSTRRKLWLMNILYLILVSDLRVVTFLLEVKQYTVIVHISCMNANIPKYLFFRFSRTMLAQVTIAWSSQSESGTGFFFLRAGRMWFGTIRSNRLATTVNSRGRTMKLHKLQKSFFKAKLKTFLFSQYFCPS